MKHRKEILPVWVRFFSWIFLLFALAPFAWLLGLENSVSFELFGLAYSGHSLHWAPTLMTVIMVFFAYTAYAILWGKDRAIDLGLASAVIGLFIAVVAMLHSLSLGGVTIRLEPIFQLLFIRALLKNREAWLEFGDHPSSGATDFSGLAESEA